MTGPQGSLFLAILAIPFTAWALEPADPASHCSRFLEKSEMEKCQSRAAQENIDWYAAALCNMQKEDTAFWKCWDSVKDQPIRLQVLKKCVDRDNDEERQACIKSSVIDSPKFLRSPASATSSDLFQPLREKHKK